MTLAEWCAQEGHGEKRRLEAVTKLGYNTIVYLAAGRYGATYDTARKLSEATGGKVTIEELCDPTGSAKRKRAHARKRVAARKPKSKRNQ